MESCPPVAPPRVDDWGDDASHIAIIPAELHHSRAQLTASYRKSYFSAEDLVQSMTSSDLFIGLLLTGIPSSCFAAIL